VLVGGWGVFAVVAGAELEALAAVTMVFLLRRRRQLSSEGLKTQIHSVILTASHNATPTESKPDDLDRGTVGRSLLFSSTQPRGGGAPIAEPVNIACQSWPNDSNTK
jgi:hypothetical protein